MYILIFLELFYFFLFISSHKYAQTSDDNLNLIIYQTTLASCFNGQLQILTYLDLFCLNEVLFHHFFICCFSQYFCYSNILKKKTAV